MQKMQLQGADELNKVLKQLPKKISDKVLVKAVRQGANIVRDEAVVSAPVGRRFNREYRSYEKKTKQGAVSMLIKLRNEIKVTITERGASGVALAVHVGRAFWGKFQEFGTKNMPARPWFRPAWDKSAPEALDAIGVSLGEEVEKAALALSGSLGKSGLVKRRRK